MKHGIVPMACKPYHIGHDLLVAQASRECDDVVVLVSKSDRENVSGERMAIVWRELIAPTLPSNVRYELGGSPIRATYELLGLASEIGSLDEWFIYGDENDVVANFPDKSLQKYAPNLASTGRVTRVPVSRKNTIDISGTAMRTFIGRGDFAAFARYVPPSIVDVAKYWTLLTQDSL